MDSWLRLFISLSVAGSGAFVLSFFITILWKDKMNAKWHYWNRKLSLFLFIIPIFMIPGFLMIEKSNSQYLLANDVPFSMSAVWLTTTIVQVIFIVWLLGVVVTSAWFIFSYHNFMKQLKINLVSVPIDNYIYEIVNHNIKNMKLKKNVDIVLCQISISPMIIGTFKPKIVLPMYDIPSEELDMIVKHELIHYKKKDLWMKKLMLLASILHWYNPLVHLLRRDINKWCELSCDEDVVVNMSRAERKAYGLTIINSVQQSNHPIVSAYLGASFSPESKNMQKRLMKIVTVEKGSKPIVFLSITFLVALISFSTVSSALTNESIPNAVDNSVDVAEYDESDNDSILSDVGGIEIISVKMSDESKFAEEDWEEIMRLVEENEIILIDD